MNRLLKALFLSTVDIAYIVRKGHPQTHLVRSTAEQPLELVILAKRGQLNILSTNFAVSSMSHSTFLSGRWDVPSSCHQSRQTMVPPKISCPHCTPHQVGTD